MMNSALNQMLNEIQQIRANNDTGEFGPNYVSPQEKQYLEAFQNDPSSYFQGLRAMGIRANPPTISNQEMQMFNAMANGAGNKLISFIHPKSTNGVLVELCQEKDL